MPRVSPNVALRGVEISTATNMITTDQNIYELSSSEEEDDSVQTATTSLPSLLPIAQPTTVSNFQFTFPIELPVFSWRVTRAFETNNIDSEWSTLIDELAVWILSKKQTKLSKSEYQAVGRTVFKLYPNISKDGFRPWSRLCRCLTQRVRKMKIRQAEKKDQH